MRLSVLRDLAGAGPVPEDVAEQVELSVKYDGYINQQNEIVRRAEGMEHSEIPLDFDFQDAHGIRTEARQKLDQMRPATLGQASPHQWGDACRHIGAHGVFEAGPGRRRTVADSSISGGTAIRFASFP